MHHRLRKAALVVFLVLFLAFAAIGTLAASPPPASAAGSWLQFQHDARHSGFNPSETVLSTGNVGSLSLLWAKRPQLDTSMESTPIPVGDRVLATTSAGRLYAVAKSDGHRVWSVNLGVPMQRTTPTVYGALAIVAGGQWDLGGTVAAYNVSNGQRVWRTHLAQSIDVSPPVLFEGKIYLGGAGGDLYALSASSGHVVWSRHLTDAEYGISGPVAVSSAGVYVIAADNVGNVFGVTRSTGQVAWRKTFGGGVYLGGAAISGTTGYIAEGDVTSEGGGTSLYAFSVSTGRLYWKQRCGSDVHVTPTVGNGVVYVGDINDEAITAIDTSNGTIRWATPLQAEIWSSPALANGVLYAGTESGLFALNASTGVQLFATQVADLGYANMSSPAVAGGRVYMGSGRGTVQVFGLK